MARGRVAETDVGREQADRLGPDHVLSVEDDAARASSAIGVTPQRPVRVPS